MTAVTRVPGGDSATAAAALRRDGTVVVTDLWTPAIIDEVREIVSLQHPEFDDPAQLEDYLGDKHERFIAPVALSEPLRATGLLNSPALLAVCEGALGEGFVFEAFGILMARGGAPAQEPHRDGGVLFPDAAVDRVLPPSAVTIAVPLVDVGHDNAPTGLAPGSHRLDPGSSHAPLVAVTTQRGSAILWDFRTLHAGLANRTNCARPALYLTACRPFWTDHGNFRLNARARLIGDPATIAALGPRFIRAQPRGGSTP